MLHLQLNAGNQQVSKSKSILEIERQRDIPGVRQFVHLVKQWLLGQIAKWLNG